MTSDALMVQEVYKIMSMSELNILVSYDTTFNLGDFYMSALIMKLNVFNLQPFIPIMYLELPSTGSATPNQQRPRSRSVVETIEPSTTAQKCNSLYGKAKNIFDNGIISLNTKTKCFVVKFLNESYMVLLFPVPKCSCVQRKDCCHIMAAKLSLNMEVKDNKTPKRNLTLMLSSCKTE
jgi:hypothetical protein